MAIGAVLKWAVTAHTNGFDIQTAGTIVFIVGLVGLVLALIYNFWWADRASRPVYGYRRRAEAAPPPEPPISRPLP